MMTHEKAEECREQLREILKEEKPRRSELVALARDVGAASYSLGEGAGSVHKLAHNIHQALQTASMIDACRTAAKSADAAEKSAEIAQEAQAGLRRSQWISVGLLVAAVASAIAAWVAKLRG